MNSTKTPVLTPVFVAWCIAVFAGVNLQAHMGWDVLARWGYLPESAIYEGKYWGLISMAFVHQEPLHLIFNLYWLWILGNAFERRLGTPAFLGFVLTTAFISSGIQMGSGEIGIGFSGVGYALFGFAWMTRTRYPDFARIINDKTVQMFVGWFFLCIVSTYIGFMKIANVAHLAGFLSGAAIGAMIAQPAKRPLLYIGLFFLAMASVIPLFWNPLSFDWVAHQAYQAMVKHDYPVATRYLQRGIEMDGDPSWCWSNLAQIYAFEGKPAEYRYALEQVRKADPEAADGIEKRYGKSQQK